MRFAWSHDIKAYRVALGLGSMHLCHVNGNCTCAIDFNWTYIFDQVTIAPYSYQQRMSSSLSSKQAVVTMKVMMAAILLCLTASLSRSLWRLCEVGTVASHKIFFSKPIFSAYH